MALRWCLQVRGTSSIKKSEIRSTKFETNSNEQNTKFKTTKLATEDTEIKNVKSEIRISKFETNPNDRNTKFKTTELATEGTEEKLKIRNQKAKLQLKIQNKICGIDGLENFVYYE